MDEIRVYETPMGWRYSVGARVDGNYMTREDARFAGIAWLKHRQQLGAEELREEDQDMISKRGSGRRQ